MQICYIAFQGRLPYPVYKALRIGLLLFLLALVLPPTAARGEGERPAEPSASHAEGEATPSVSPEAPGPVERALSEREVLVLAGRLLGQGRTDEAAVLLRVLMTQGRNPEHRIEAAFQLAGIAMGAGKYREAVNLYQNILNQRPDLPRVRLELA
ncbi:MAG: hypothetical protein LBM00_05090, partial [Deltaproteobacteria bacterium]|nr:hypothetical protein [Deltaproteobacteria bacterium]